MFIPLTLFRDKNDKDVIWENMDALLRFYRAKDSEGNECTYLVPRNKEWPVVVVRETPEEIVAMIEGRKDLPPS